MEPGSYEVVIDQAATRASVTGLGLGGSYVHDGTPDQLTVTDTDGGSAYTVALSNGMTLSEIVDALKAGFGTAGDSGSIQTIVDGLDTQKRKYDDRITKFEARLDLRSQNMIKRFSALEEAMSRAQLQLRWLQAQLGTLLTSAG